MTERKASSGFFRSFAVYDQKGNIDLKKSLKAFEGAFMAWQEEESEIKPAVLTELKSHPRLGQGNLVKFVIHRLNLRPIRENEERVLAVLEEMVKTGSITYETPNAETRRGRGSGYKLSSPPPAVQ